MPGGWGWDDDGPDPELVAANGRRQARVVQKLIRQATRSGAPFCLMPGHVYGLHRIAMQGVITTAGRPRRDGELVIAHTPPPFDQVPALVEQMCADVAARWNDEGPIDLGAYVLWRTCWIHPFEDGNGRTARALAYLIICTRFGFPLPGRYPIPQRVTHHRRRYFDALTNADRAWTRGTLDVTDLKSLLRRTLREQLTDAPLDPGEG